MSFLYLDTLFLLLSLSHHRHGHDLSHLTAPSCRCLTHTHTHTCLLRSPHAAWFNESSVSYTLISLINSQKFLQHFTSSLFLLLYKNKVISRTRWPCSISHMNLSHLFLSQCLSLVSSSHFYINSDVLLIGFCDLLIKTFAHWLKLAD